MSDPVHHVALPFDLGPSDEPILTMLGLYFYLTAAQITRLLYAPASHTYAQARLKRLVDAGYLQRLFLPRPSRTGSAPLVYTLARKGLNALREWGSAVDRRYRPAEARELSYLHLAHTLALNDALIALELLCRKNPRIQIADLRHERVLKLHPVVVALPDGAKTGVIPDGWVDLRIAGCYQECYAIELDRGTTEGKAWRRKVAALLAYADGPYQRVFGTPSLTIAVIATPVQRRRAVLLRWTEAELRAQGREDAAGLFHFTGATLADQDPEQLFLSAVWSEPFSDHLEPLIDASGISDRRESAATPARFDTSIPLYSRALEMSDG
jgi:hypothetical protein